MFVAGQQCFASSAATRLPNAGNCTRARGNVQWRVCVGHRSRELKSKEEREPRAEDRLDWEADFCLSPTVRCYPS